jgi:putative hemolysin
VSEIAGSLAIIAGLLVCSAFFSGTEVAMFSLRRTDRATLARSGRTGDRLVLDMLSRPSRLIATLLIGNETVNVSMAAVIAGLADQLFPGRGQLELGLLAVGCSLPLVLLLGEITPKTFAIKGPRTWARRTIRPLWLFYLVVTPIRIVVRGVADLVAWPLGGRATTAGRDLSEAEFKALVDAGSAEGQVGAEERSMIHRVFALGDKTVAEAMRPRAGIFALSYELPLGRLTREIAARGFSRVPIYGKGLDDIRGVLHAQDLVAQASGLTSPRRLAELLHEPLFVPQSTRLDRLLRLFKHEKTHMALVVDEYGKLSGIVTMEDLLHQLFGGIAAERAAAEAAAPAEEAPQAMLTPDPEAPR